MRVDFPLECSDRAHRKAAWRPPPRTILVIDDEPSVVRALTGLLSRDGYSVGTASNGQHALTSSRSGTMT